MKRKSLLFSILALFLAVSMVFAVGCNNNKPDDNVDVPESQTSYTILFDDVALINGQSFTLDAKLLLEGKLVKGTFSYQIADSSVASITDGKVTANKIGTTTITATANYADKQVATKTINCTVSNNEGIAMDAHEYTVYISDSVHGQAFNTTETVSAKVFKNGQQIDGAVVSWTSADASIATIDSNGKITAVKVGKTYIEGTYENLKTVKIPVEVAIPVLQTQMNVVLDTRLAYSPIDANTVLGNGKVVGSAKDADTGASYLVSNNAVATEGLKVGEYRCIFYDSNNLTGCEVNLIVADYVVNNKSDFMNIGRNGNAKYMVITTDISHVGVYDMSDMVGKNDQSRFTGVFNGLGHTIEGLNIVTQSFGGLFGYANDGAVFKNVSFVNARVGQGNSGIFFFQSGGKVLFDNVYVQAEVDTDWGSGALYGMNFGGQVTIQNSIIVAEGKGLKTNAKGLTFCGAISGRAKNVPVFTNTYIVSSGMIVANGMASDPHSQAFGKINIIPIIYPNAQAFIDEREKTNSAIDFSTFNDFWDLTKGVPCFK